MQIFILVVCNPLERGRSMVTACLKRRGTSREQVGQANIAEQGLLEFGQTYTIYIYICRYCVHAYRYTHASSVNLSDVIAVSFNFA